MLLAQAPGVSVSPDFEVGVAASNLTGSPGIDTPELINVTALNGFSGNVSLTLSPSAGVYASLIPYCYCVIVNSTTPSNDAQMLMTAPNPGTYTVNVTGTEGSVSHKVTITYKVIPYSADDFGLYVPMPFDMIRGSTEHFHVSLQGLKSFAWTGAQTIHLKEGSLPRGLITSLSLATIVIQFSAPAGSYTSDINVTAPSTIPLGQYTIFVSATNGTITHLRLINVNVQAAFAISAPNTLNVKQGTQSVSTLTLNGLSGYQGTIRLTATYDNQYLTISLTPAVLTLSTTTTSANSTISVSADAMTPSGRYNVIVIGSDGIIQKSAPLIVIATGLDFAISASPSSLTFRQGTIGTQTTMITLASLNSFSGNVAVTATATSYFKQYSNELTLILDSTSVALGPGTVASLTLTVTVRSNATIGPYSVGINGSATINGIAIIHSIGLEATVGPDFTISADTSSLIVHQGSLGTVTITFRSLNGFSGGLALEPAPLSALPPDPQASFYPSYPILSPGGTNTTRLLVEATSQIGLGNYSIVIVVTDDYVSHGLPFTIIVEPPVTGSDFTIYTSPNDTSLAIGSSARTTVVVTSLNGFAGSLSLEPFTNVPAAMSPSTVTLTPGGTATSTMTFTVPLRTDLYPEFPAYYQSGAGKLLVAGLSSTGVGHGATIKVTVTPFNVTASSSQLEIKPSSSGTSDIIVSQVYGWTGVVNLIATVSPTGPRVSLSATTLNITGTPPSASSTLTVEVPASTPEGDYNVTVKTVYKIPVFFTTPLLNYTTTIMIMVRSNAGGSGPSNGSGPGPSGGPSTAPPIGSGIEPQSATIYEMVGVALAALLMVSAVMIVVKRKGTPSS